MHLHCMSRMEWPRQRFVRAREQPGRANGKAHRASTFSCYIGPQQLKLRNVCYSKCCIVNKPCWPPLAKLVGLTYITINTAGPSALVHGSAFLYLPLVQPYTKPFLPVADQIARIQARGMVITDHGKAQQYLENIGYYRLSGYWYPLRRSQIATASSGEIVTTVLDDFRSGS